MTRKISDEEALLVLRDAGYEPITTFPGASKGWKSKCAVCGVISYPRYSNVKNSGSRCRNCKRGQLSQIEIGNRLKKWNLLGLEEFYNTKRSMLFKCLVCKNKFRSTIKDLQNVKVKCPKCLNNNKKLFIDNAKKLMKQANLLPLEPYKDSHTPWKSRCLNCRRTVSPSFGTVKRGHNGCGYCSKVKVDQNQAVELLNSKGIKPVEPYKNAHSPWRSMCLNCGNEIYPRLNGIKQGQGGCTSCGVKKRSESKKLSQAEAIEVMIKSDLQPLVEYENSKTPWKSKCLKCQSIVYPKLNTIVSGDGGCKYCGKNFVDSKDAKKFIQGKGFTVLEPYPGANKPWQMKHKKCGRIVNPSYSSLKRGGNCKFCTNKGFQFHLPGYVYLATNSALQAHKIGIATIGIRSDRMIEHEKYGWVLWRSKTFDLGNNAYLVEQLTLNWLREDRKLPIFLSSKQMPQGGFTETVDASEIDLSAIWSKVEEFSGEITNRR
jgi:hypothetical protein